MINFTDIEYLKVGNNKQQKVYKVIKDYKIFDHLKDFHPVLAGTIPIEIDTDKSDLDIICYWKDRSQFIKCLNNNFSAYSDYHLQEKTKRGHFTIMANFKISDFEVEIFGQNRPVIEQEAYKHMIIEYKLLLTYGLSFRNKIIELKKQGIKTEPAFAQLLGLRDDPFEELLSIDI